MNYAKPPLYRIVKESLDYALEFYRKTMEDSRERGEIINHDTLFVKVLGKNLRHILGDCLEGKYDKEIQEAIIKVMGERVN